MVTFKNFVEQKLQWAKHVQIRDANGKIVHVKNVVYRGADMKLHSAPPGKSASSGGGGGGR